MISEQKEQQESIQVQYLNSLMEMILLSIMTVMNLPRM